MLVPEQHSDGVSVALRKESVDRNTHYIANNKLFQVSLSARRAWIEILDKLIFVIGSPVALRKESVDRNTLLSCFTIIDAKVALRKESVDRNRGSVFFIVFNARSLSARRAWIEICQNERQQ